jgi:porphobilinogen synthase
VEKAKELRDLGVSGIYLIGIPRTKDAHASDAYSEEGVIQTVTRKIKKATGQDLVVIGDSYLGYFTHHQIGGVLDDKGTIQDGPTLELVKKIAIKWAESGVDVFCNSTMVDGRVFVAREALDEAGFDDTLIMSSIKFNSAFYLSGAGLTGTGESYSYDKGVYYMDPANADDPLRMALLDVEQGTDILNVKPATPYMDIIQRVKNQCGITVSAYSIAGDYSMISFGSQKGNLNEKDSVLELMTSIRRSGADIIITYWADKLAKWLP